MVKYSSEQKLETVLHVKERHMSKISASKLNGFSDSQVHRWVRLL